MTRLEKLSAKNFLFICDISMDIMEKVQILERENVEIPLTTGIIRYSELMPFDSPQQRSQYCEGRKTALEYLQKNKYVKVFKINFAPDGGWQGIINVKLDLSEFKKFYSHLCKVYSRRVVNKRDKNSQELYKYVKYENKEIVPLNLPEGTTWENIIIKFNDGHTITIRLSNDKSFSKKTTYTDMGLDDSKQNKPNQQWMLLEYLSVHNGELFWEDVGGINNAKKKKQRLSNALKTFFQIDNDPFCNYKKEGGYRIKLRLIPEKENNNNQSKQQDNAGRDDALGIEEFRNEIAPQVYDK